MAAQACDSQRVTARPRPLPDASFKDAALLHHLRKAGQIEAQQRFGVMMSAKDIESGFGQSIKPQDMMTIFKMQWPRLLCRKNRGA